MTGAASGIGRASALALARAGAKVVASDVATDGGQRHDPLGLGPADRDA